jgi:hypothetical protein
MTLSVTADLRVNATHARQITVVPLELALKSVSILMR